MGLLDGFWDNVMDVHDTITAPFRFDHGLIARDRREREARRQERKEEGEEEE